MLYQIEECKTVKDKLFNEFNIEIKRSYIGVDDFDVPGRTIMYQVPVPVWYDHRLDDEELFKRLNALQEITGEIYVVVNTCHRYNGFGPFFLEAEKLEGLIKHHYEIFKQTFFDTNAIIISFLKKKVWMFHHSGFVGLFDYSQLVNKSIENIVSRNSVGRMLYRIEDWQTIKDKIFQRFKINIEKTKFGIDAFDLCPTMLQETLDIEQISDEELFWILDDLHEITGEICFITQICYKEGFGPFLLEADRLGGLIENYNWIFKEHFYDKNVIIISFSQKVVWLVNCLGFVELIKM